MDNVKCLLNGSQFNAVVRERCFTDKMCVVSLVFGGIILLFLYLKWNNTYWEKRKLPFISPKIVLGNVENPFRKTKSVGYLFKSFYDHFSIHNARHGGFYLFLTPIYMPIDPEYVKNIMSKDFSYFIDRGTYYNEKDDPLSAHLFSIGGTKWKNLRAKLTPTFTSGKMKMMFSILVECGKQLEEIMHIRSTSNQPVDIKEALGCFTTDIIGSCAFGLECNSFKDSDSDAAFRKYGKKVLQRNALTSLKAALSFSFPNICRKLGVKIVPNDVSSFFMKIIKDTVEYREKNNYSRKDFLQILIDLKNSEETGEAGKSLTIDEMAAQAFVFFVAGFETSSTTVTFCLYELSMNQEIQKKVREEINTVLQKHEGKITYDAISEMKYMTQVLDETLRKYPPVPFLTRQCVQDYKVPNESLVIKKGTNVMISVVGLQNDPKHFEKPEIFEPERFSEGNKSNITPFTYLPFGEGPRLCIGLRFGMMQSKVALTILLKKYNFTLNPKTKQPLQMEVNSFVPSADGGIWLDAKEL